MRLFEPFEFSGMKLKNRVVSVPVVSNLATEDGYVTDNLIEWDAESCMTLSQFLSRLNKRTHPQKNTPPKKP